MTTDALRRECDEPQGSRSALAGSERGGAPSVSPADGPAPLVQGKGGAYRLPASGKSGHAHHRAQGPKR